MRQWDIYNHTQPEGWKTFTHAVVDHSNKVNKELFANEAKNGTIQVSNSMTPRQLATGLISCQLQTLHSAKHALNFFKRHPTLAQLLCRASYLIHKNIKMKKVAVESIPDICKFWYTTTLYWSVKVHQKVREFATKQRKLRVFYAKKSTPPLALVVLISARVESHVEHFSQLIGRESLQSEAKNCSCCFAVSVLLIEL